MFEITDVGIIRFRKNRIVSDVHDYHYDLNKIEMLYQEGRYTLQEKYEYLGLLGYSVDGLMDKLYQDKAIQKDED